MSKNVLRFLWHGAYHVVVRGGSHFCQSPKSGGVRSFLIKTWGRANTFFWKKIPKFPSPPSPRKNVPSLSRRQSFAAKLVCWRFLFLFLFFFENNTWDNLFRALALRQSEWANVQSFVALTKRQPLETPDLDTLYSGQFTLIIDGWWKQIIFLYPPPTQYPSFFRNLPRLTIWFVSLGWNSEIGL